MQEIFYTIATMACHWYLGFTAGQYIAEQMCNYRYEMFDKQTKIKLLCIGISMTIWAVIMIAYWI